MRVLEQHEVLQVLPCVELEVVFLVASEEIADLPVELPLVVEADLKLAHLILKPLPYNYLF